MMMSVHVIGSGIAGLSCAYMLIQTGNQVTLTTASTGPDASCCSWWAGGMLAPFCEQESAEPLIGKLGLESMTFWQALSTQNNALIYHNAGTIVLASARDKPLIHNFAKRTIDAQRLDANAIKALEPDLAHFSDGLFFPQEAHIEPRIATQVLWESLLSSGLTVNCQQTLTETEIKSAEKKFDWQIDCRGLSANSVLKDLRGVKGEMLHIYSKEVTLTRPIRLLHPRFPLYIVPRPKHQFMIGATMIESNDSKYATVRSVLELLSAAYTVHPAFAEAEIIEIGVDARPAFNDNLPKIRRSGNTLYVNGLYRHGFLAAPAVARRVVDLIINDQFCTEVVDENYA